MRDPRIIAVVAACALYAGYSLLMQPPGPLTAPDTIAYVNMHPIVPIGYPLIVKAVGTSALPWLQPIVFAIAMACFGIQLLRVTNSAAVALIGIAGALTTPGLTSIHASILTESLFLSGVVAFVAAAIQSLRAPSWTSVATASLIAGTASVIRRSAVAWLPVLLLIWWLVRRRLSDQQLSMLLAALLPMTLVLVADQIAARAIHGRELSSLMGPHLFAKAALVDAPVDSSSTGPIEQRLHDYLATTSAPVRTLIDAAPPNIRATLTLYYETCFQGPCVAEVKKGLDPLSDTQKNDALARAAAPRLLAAPFEFVMLTARHYGSFWTAFKQQHTETADALNKYVAANRPLPFEREAFKVAPGEPIVFTPAGWVTILQPIIIGVGWVTLAMGVSVTLAASRYEIPPALGGAAVAAATAHGSLLFSAVAAAGISRFIISVWPAVTTAVLLTAWCVFDKTLGRDRSARYD